MCGALYYSSLPTCLSPYGAGEKYKHKSIHPLKETVGSRFTALPQNEGNLEIVHGIFSLLGI